MPLFLRHAAPSLLACLTLAGCSAGVREDRTITFASDGRQVAFQHGRDGIYVAETEDAAPTRIFQPDEDVIAVGTPAWSPIDKRLIFTTARSAQRAANGTQGLPAEQDPAGNLHGERPITYTCWLRSEPKAGQPLNVPLFTARCGHPGYVAANLAVRWHPDGQHILYIEQEPGGRHGLFEFDLQTKASRQVFPHRGDALIFDWTPDSQHLVCVVGDSSSTAEPCGIWIGRPGEKDWWRVPDSAVLPPGDRSQLLTRLRAALPTWTRQGDRFAFVQAAQTSVPVQAIPGAEAPPAKRAFTLHIGTRTMRTVQALIHTDRPLRDLHWRPDGERLGFLVGDEIGVFHLANPADKRERVLDLPDLCGFLGWDVAGEQLAFVARQPLTPDPRKSWVFLLLPDVRARNRVLVAPDEHPEQSRAVFSEMQVTFPKWSPTEAKLSLWATFRPPYRSWLSHMLELGGDAQDPLRGLTLRAGDPALVLDPATGARRWKAIDAHEKTQVGHYHLLRREYAEAWRWYEQAAPGAPDAQDRSPQQFVRRFVQGRDALFFEAYCLDRLGRRDEARAFRRRFEESFLPDLPAAPKAPAPGQPLAAFGAADLQPTKEQLRHWRNLYIAEVFLSLDAIEEGERFFRAGLRSAETDADRLSHALILTQFLLLRDRHEEYAELATDTVLPLLLRVWKPRASPGAPLQPGNFVLAYADGLSLLPLFCPEFLARLSDPQVRQLVGRWEKLRPRADDDVKRLGIDLFLHAAAERQGRRAEREVLARRIADNPERGTILGEKGVAGLLESVRNAPEFFEGLRQLRVH